MLSYIASCFELCSTYTLATLKNKPDGLIIDAGNDFAYLVFVSQFFFRITNRPFDKEAILLFAKQSEEVTPCCGDRNPRLLQERTGPFDIFLRLFTLSVLAK